MTAEHVPAEQSAMDLWHADCNKLPLVTPFAQDVLAMPSSEASAEQVFLRTVVCTAYMSL